MLPPTTAPQMPMGQSAKLPLTAADLLPSIKAPAAPPTASQGLVGAAAGQPAGAPSNQPPYQVELQPDGSSIYFVPGPSGGRSDGIVIGVNSPPKLPKAMQPPTQ